MQAESLRILKIAQTIFADAREAGAGRHILGKPDNFFSFF